MNNNMQMNQPAGHGLLLLLVALLLSYCTDPTSVGSDLLEEDRVNSAFTDTVTILSRTLEGDSVATYSLSAPRWLSGYLLGDFSDPLFGRTVAEIYTQPTLNVALGSFTRPDFPANAMLDSIVLVLPYNANTFYGNTDELFQVEINELTDSLSVDSTYFSNRRFAFGQSLGSKTFTPSLDSFPVLDYRSGSSPDTFQVAQLRIQLDAAFGQRLLSLDSATYSLNSNFINHFKGLAIRAVTPTAGMIGFTLAPDSGGGFFDAGIYVYYRADTLNQQYRFPISVSSPVVSYLENDHSNTPVAPFIGSSMFSDSLAFLQGTEGLLVELEFPNLEGLENVVVNKAELVVPVASLSGDDPDLYPPARQLLVFRRDMQSGNFVPIDDYLLPDPSRRTTVFGGLLETGTNGQPDVYRLNISLHFQEMLKDNRTTDISDVIYLSITPRGSRASRSVLYGGTHPTNPIKLNLIYTVQ